MEAQRLFREHLVATGQHPRKGEAEDEGEEVRGKLRRHGDDPGC